VRLIEAGLRLFVQHGIDGTPITKIEAEGGLAPGSGAFYKHFRSKQELVAAAIGDAAAAMRKATQPDLPPELSVSEQLALIAWGTLAQLDARRDLLLVMMREPGVSVDPEVWPADGHRWFSDWLAAQHELGSLHTPDPDARAVLLLGALTQLWLNRQRPAAAALGVDQQRLVNEWVELAGAKVEP
jgi:AcrR family transcriptional regulator